MGYLIVNRLFSRYNLVQVLERGKKILEYKQKSEHLANKFQHLFFDIVNTAPLSVIVTDEKFQIEYVNHYFSELTGYSFEEALGENPSMLKSGLTPISTYKALYYALEEDGKWIGTFINRKKNGEVYSEYASIFVTHDNEQQRHYVAFKQDITEYAKLRENTYMDSITRLYNRRYLDENLTLVLDKMKQKHQPLSIVFIDLDAFKCINDQYGHLVGDKILVGVARVIQLRLKVPEAWCARYGGDEFIVCMPNTGQTTAGRFASDVVTSLERKVFKIEGQAINVTCSIGVLTLHTYDKFFSASDILMQADRKLYEAKLLGKNRVVL